MLADQSPLRKEESIEFPCQINECHLLGTFTLVSEIAKAENFSITANEEHGKNP